MTTWMIVEDEPDIYDMLLAMSNMLGNEGIAFVDGDEAIAWVEEVDGGRYQGELPELALLDIRLPTKISGPMVGARLRQSPTVGQIGVVLLTAYHLNEEQEKEVIREAGADLLLTKPLPKMGELKEKLAEVVAKRSAMQPPKAEAATTSSTNASAAQPATSPAAPSTPLPPRTTAPETPSASVPPKPIQPNGSNGKH